MRLFSHRSAALAVAALGLARAWPDARSLWAIALVGGGALALIWFPDTIDDLTFGSCQRGYQIDSHTPPWMICGFGWSLLLLITVALYWRGFLSRLVGL